MEPQEQHGRLFLTGVSTILIIVFLALTAVVLIVWRSKSQAPQSASTSQTAPTSQFKGTMKLQDTTTQTTYAVGDTISMRVVADSGSSEIVGYDLDVLFGEGTEFVSAVSLLPDFDVRTSTKEAGMVLTGFKKLSAAGGSVFSQTPLAELTFRLGGQGTVSFVPQLVPGQKTQSNLIDINNNNVLVTVEGMDLQVQ